MNPIYSTDASQLLSSVESPAARRIGVTPKITMVTVCQASIKYCTDHSTLLKWRFNSSVVDMRRGNIPRQKNWRQSRQEELAHYYQAV